MTLRVASLREAIDCWAECVRSGKVWWYLLLCAIIVAIPLAPELSVLVDIATTMGVDIFFLSILYYLSSAVVESLAPLRERCRLTLLSQGVAWPQRWWRESPRTFTCLLAHNLCALVTPTRFVVLALLCLTVPAVLSLFGLRHVA